MPEKKSKFRSVSLREELIAEIERVIERHKDLGYRSVAEFFADAGRRRIEEIRKTPLEK